jgi:hypothetical protein
MAWKLAKSIFEVVVVLIAWKTLTEMHAPEKASCEPGCCSVEVRAFSRPAASLRRHPIQLTPPARMSTATQ